MITMITGIGISSSRFSEVPQVPGGEEVTPGAEAVLICSGPEQGEAAKVEARWDGRRGNRSRALHTPSRCHSLFPFAGTFSLPPPPYPLPLLSFSDGCFQYQMVHFLHKTVRLGQITGWTGLSEFPCTLGCSLEFQV